MPENASLADWLASLSADERTGILRELTEAEFRRLEELEQNGNAADAGAAAMKMQADPAAAPVDGEAKRMAEEAFYQIMTQVDAMLPTYSQQLTLVTGKEIRFEIDWSSVPHDAVEPVGFVFHHGEGALGVLTDLGCTTKLALERVRQVDTLLIETNHDEKLLQNDLHRPWSVKQRIMSRHGHLSNAAAATVLVELLEFRLEQAVLGHLSRDCNSPELALGEVRQRVKALGGTLEVHCATQREVSPRLAVRRPRVGMASRGGEQGELPF